MYVMSKHLKSTIQGQEHLIRTRGTDGKETAIPVGTAVYIHVNKQIRIPGSPLRSTCSQCSLLCDENKRIMYAELTGKESSMDPSNLAKGISKC